MPSLRAIAAAVRVRRAGADEPMSVVEHLDELRRRLLVAAASLLVALVGAYLLRARILALLVRPLPPAHRRLVTFSPTEAFTTTLKVVVGAALLIALPVLLYQLYAYLAPAVPGVARTRAWLVVGGTSLLFLGGVVFGYAVVLPAALRFLLGFGGNTFTTSLRAGDYIGFAMTLALASGLVFQVPPLMAGLASTGVAGPAQFRRFRRVAIVLEAGVAAFLPGGDPVSMILVLTAMVALYEVGIGLAVLVERRTTAAPAPA